jgi:hypothetical protein
MSSVRFFPCIESLLLTALGFEEQSLTGAGLGLRPRIVGNDSKSIEYSMTCGFVRL